MSSRPTDPFNARVTFDTGSGEAAMYRLAALEEAGDLIIPLQNDDITHEHIVAELGEIVAGIHPGRNTPAQITFFKSVGVAVQDAAAAGVVMAVAERLKNGNRRPNR